MIGRVLKVTSVAYVEVIYRLNCCSVVMLRLELSFELLSVTTAKKSRRKAEKEQKRAKESKKGEVKKIREKAGEKKT